MSKIAVVYWSGTGNTEAMANLVAEGATSAGAETEVIPCADFSADKAAEYDAFAFGCPAMGSEELEYDEFQPMWDEVKAVSYTHLTLPTKRIDEISVVAVSFKKKKRKRES